MARAVAGIDASQYTGYDSTGATDSTAAINAAIADAVVTGPKIVLIKGSPKCTSALAALTDRGLTLKGTGRDRGTNLQFTGTGRFLTNGTDTHSGDHSGNYYDGINSLVIEDMTISVPVASQDTALDNGQGNYKTGTTAITDWYGGDIRLRRVTITNFDTPFYGLQSDIDHWEDVIVSYCHSGIYLGPRSDQLNARGVYCLLNDRALDVDRCQGMRLYGWQFVGNGTASTNPIRVRSAWSSASFNVVFDKCWFEHLQGYAAAAVEAFVEVGVGDSVKSTGVVFDHSTIMTNVSPTLPRAQYLVKVDQGSSVDIWNPGGQYVNNLDALIHYVGATGNCFARIDNSGDVTVPSYVDAAAGGTLRVFRSAWNANGQAMLDFTSGPSGAAARARILPSATVPAFQHVDSGGIARTQFIGVPASSIANIDGPTIRIRDAMNGGTTRFESDATTGVRIDQGSGLIKALHDGMAKTTKLYSGHYHPIIASNSLTTDNTLGFGTARAIPFYVPATTTLVRVAAEFTGAGDADSFLRILFWSSLASGLPGAFFFDAGSISTGSGNAGTVATGGTPGVYENTISKAFTPGVYWVAGVVVGTTATTQPTIRVYSVVDVPLVSAGTTLPTAGATATAFTMGGVGLATTADFSATPSAGGKPARIFVKPA